MSGFEINAQLENADQMLADLKKLEQKLQDKAVRSGLVAFVAPIKRKAKELAPKMSGDMAKAIGHRQLSKRAKGRLGIASTTQALLVGPNRKVNGKYQGKKGLWHEYGTERMNMNPFLLPAMQSEASGGASRFYDGLKRALDK